MIATLYDIWTGSRISCSTACDVVEHTCRRYRTTSPIPKPWPTALRPPNEMAMASPSSFMPSIRPHPQSAMPRTVRPDQCVRRASASHRLGG